MCPLLAPCHICINNQRTYLLCKFGSFFSLSPFPCFLGNFFGNFWPPSMPIWGPKVSLWTLTPNFIIWAWNQPENGACLSILWCFFNFFHVWVFWVKMLPYNAYRKDLICIENAKMKKPRKSHPHKFQNKECDFLGNAKSSPIFHIRSFSSQKCFSTKFLNYSLFKA